MTGVRWQVSGTVRAAAGPDRRFRRWQHGRVGEVTAPDKDAALAKARRVFGHVRDLTVQSMASVEAARTERRPTPPTEDQ